jgi:ATP-dependent exoDNAse (exonuclease V) beta subunit
MPHPKSHEGDQQEQNLKYVACTRAKRELFFIEPLKANGGE